MAAHLTHLVTELVRSLPGGGAPPATVLPDLDDAAIASYVPDAIRAFTACETRPWVALPPHEAGQGARLEPIAAAIPGAWYRRYPTVDVLAVPAIARALVVDRARDGLPERYGVADLGPDGRRLDPPAAGGRRVLGTFTPTDDQLRRWAYDPALALTSQDEELAVQGARADLLLALAADPACPRRDRVRAALLHDGLWQILTDGPRHLPAMKALAARLTASDDPVLRGDGEAIAALVAYLEGTGPVDRTAAERVARALLAGVAPVTLDAGDAGPWWRFTVAGRPPTQRVYVAPATGAVAYRRGPEVAGELAGVVAPAARAGLLGGGA